MLQLHDVLGVAIGSCVRVWRLRRGITQTELARRIESHRPVVCRIERGAHVPDLATLRALASALELRWAEFVESVIWQDVDAAALASLKENA